MRTLYIITLSVVYCLKIQFSSTKQYDTRKNAKNRNNNLAN